MMESNTLMELINGIKTGDGWIITGVVILLLVPIIRNAVLPELENTAKYITSSLSAAFGGVAVLLVSGQEWWVALILGLFAVPTSSGLVPLVRSLVRLILKKSPTFAKMLLFFSVTLATGCASLQNQPCQIEKQIVNSVGVGLIATETVIGENENEHYETAMTAARGVQLLGHQAVQACELARDGAAWQQWVMLALETVGAVVGVIEGASEEIDASAPSELLDAMEDLRNEINQTPVVTVVE